MITLGSAQPLKLNISVIVTPACAADMEIEVLVACGTPECGLPLLVGHVSVCGGRQVFLQVLVVFGATNHAEIVGGGGRGTFVMVLSHTLQTKEVRLLGPGFTAVDCCGLVTDELQAEFIYKHVEGAKAVAHTGVVSRLVQSWDLVVLVHGSHVPETRGKVKSGGPHGSGVSWWPAREWGLVLFSHGIWSFLCTAPMYLKQEAKLEYPEGEHSCKIV